MNRRLCSAVTAGTLILFAAGRTSAQDARPKPDDIYRCPLSGVELTGADAELHRKLHEALATVELNKVPYPKALAAIAELWKVTVVSANTALPDPAGTVVSLSFKDATLESVLDALADSVGLDPAVDGRFRFIPSHGVLYVGVGNEGFPRRLERRFYDVRDLLEPDKDRTESDARAKEIADFLGLTGLYKCCNSPDDEPAQDAVVFEGRLVVAGEYSAHRRVERLLTGLRRAVTGRDNPAAAARRRRNEEADRRLDARLDEFAVSDKSGADALAELKSRAKLPVLETFVPGLDDAFPGDPVTLRLKDVSARAALQAILQAERRGRRFAVADGMVRVGIHPDLSARASEEFYVVRDLLRREAGMTEESAKILQLVALVPGLEHRAGLDNERYQWIRAWRGVVLVHGNAVQHGEVDKLLAELRRRLPPG